MAESFRDIRTSDREATAIEAKTQDGYVQDYTLELQSDPGSVDKRVYFSVRVTDDRTDDGAPPENTKPIEWVLERHNLSSRVDRDDNGNHWAVSFGNVHAAIIATFKEALIHGNKVTVVGAVDRDGPTNRIASVTLQK